MMKREYPFIWFNSRFENYGCNKVQMIEHLRMTSGNSKQKSLVDHVFYILHNAFSSDVVHPE